MMWRTISPPTIVLLFAAGGLPSFISAEETHRISITQPNILFNSTNKNSTSFQHIASLFAGGDDLSSAPKEHRYKVSDHRNDTILQDTTIPGDLIGNIASSSTEAESSLYEYRDPEFEEKLRLGRVDISDIPHHLLKFDENGNAIMNPPKSRFLSQESSEIGTFHRLDCNPSSWSSCNSLVSNIIPSNSNNPLIVPCGQCFTFDIEGNVTFNGGIDIQGRLEFPINHKAIIHAKYIIVQGELDIEVNHPTIKYENEGVRFILTGTQDVIFNPAQPNDAACPNNGCLLGPKPFLIAGGKVRIDSIPDNKCKTHTPVLKKIYQSPIYSPDDFPSVVTLPESCPISGLQFVSYDFESTLGNWTGREGAFVSLTSDGALAVTNRKLRERGPHLDITPISPMSCLVPNQDYLFVARMKLDMANGTMQGQSTTCKTSGEYCPRLSARYHDLSYDRRNTKKYLAQSIAPNYGQWFDLTGAITFDENELSPNNVYLSLMLDGPEPDINIHLDSFDLFLPSEISYPDPDALCTELVFNGNAEGNGFNPYPMENDAWSERIFILEEEDGNKFFRLADRNSHSSSMKYHLDINCFVRGVTYTITSRVRYHHQDGFVGGSESYYWYVRYESGLDGSWRDRTIVNCNAQSVDDGWVTCTGNFIIDKDLGEATDAWLKMKIDNSSDGDKYDIDYDDINIVFHEGYVNDVVVDSDDVSCWGEAVDVHLTSATYYSWASEKSNGFVSQVLSIVDNLDGTANIRLNEAPVLPIISEEENRDHAVSIALLSRNIKIEGEQEEESKGGYMQVLHTPSAVQVMKGIEFVNMGRRSEIDRFALQFLFSGELPDTLVSQNSFRQSNNRCIVLEGTSNLTLSQNVAWQATGHCIYIGHQSQFNVIEQNLVSDTNSISYSERIEGETDYNSAAFFNWFGPNDYISNTAVGNQRDGFVIENPYRARFENRTEFDVYPRRVKMGLFRQNRAKSNGDIGIRMLFLQSNEENFIENAIVLKNRFVGLYIYYSWNVTIDGCVFADNTQYNIETRYDDNIQIKDTVVRGYTPETKVIVKPPYFNKPCISSNFFPPIGYRMPTFINRWDDEWVNSLNKGATLVNVTFTNFDHSDECETSVPIRFNTNDKRNNHFDYTSSFQSVTFDTLKFMDGLTSDVNGVGDIVITDVDGSSNPLGTSSLFGSFVSTKTRLTSFVDNCISYPQGISYCKDACYHTVSFIVDQTDTIDYSLNITRTTDGKEILVDGTYEFDDDLHRYQYYDNRRFFSISLPLGSYKIAFLKDDLEPAWPRFVLPRWEGIPQCQGFVSASEIILLEPPSLNCDQLIVNGNMEQGTYHWQHNNGNSDTIYGGLVAVDGEGIDGSIALRHYNRRNGYAGIGQDIDTRCLHQNLDKFYEIEVWFRLETNTIPFVCNPFSNSWDVRCPRITIRTQRYVDEILENSYVHYANTIVPNDSDHFNLIHGVVKVDEYMNSIERAWIYIESAHQDFDFIIDNFSVQRLPGICDGNLVRNGNFDSNGKFWRPYGDVHYEFDVPSGQAIKVFNKQHPDDGIYQDLYIDKDCDFFKTGERFLITGRFRIESTMDGTPYECDRTMSDGLLECSSLLLKTKHRDGDLNTRYAETVAIASDTSEGWSLMAGILTVNEKQADHDGMYLRLYGPHESMNVFYDDISIEPISKSCESLVYNDNFETGDSRFWKPSSSSGSIDFHITSQGAGGSEYALLIQKYTSHRIYQELDTRCFEEGQEFEITALLKLVNVTDLIAPVVCNPSEASVYNSDHCPTITIRGKNCDVPDFEYKFWNTNDELEYDSNGFYRYNNVFEVDQDLASCADVYVELGRWVHEGTALVVDDVKILQRTTLSPTLSPTFSPTESIDAGPTSTPTIKTDAPTTSFLFTCPDAGTSPIELPTGPVMLQHAGYGKLCTLTKVGSSDAGNETVVPIARSYDNNSWEKSAGEFATSLFYGKEILCYISGCQLMLPPTDGSAVYLLSAYTYSLSEKDQYARFLETATFGVTKEELDSMTASSRNVNEEIAVWVSNQMNETVIPVTSHRQNWRRGLNPRVPTSTSIGIPHHPCDKNSRWRKITFVRNDNMWYVDKKLRVIGNGPFRLELNGWMRTIVDDFWVDHSEYTDYIFDPTFDYELCNNPEEMINGRLYIKLQDETCVSVQNPVVNVAGYESNLIMFDLPDEELNPIDLNWTNEEPLEFILETSLFDDPTFSSMCSELPLVPELGDEPIFGKMSDGTYLLFDPRLVVQKNDLDNPIIDGGKNAVLASGGDTFCSNVPRTFLNEETCVISSDACKPSANNQVDILLEHSTIAAINNLTGHYVYAIQGLLVSYEGISLQHPCTPGLRSRWEPQSTCIPTELYNATNATLHELILKSGDQNPYIRDIYFPQTESGCDVGDMDPVIEIEVNGQCWKRVHDEHMSTFDMSYWVENHPGGPNAIQKWAQNNGTILIYPSVLEREPHGMSRWNNNWQKFSYVGRFGDTLRLGDLPNDLRSEQVTNYFDPSSNDHQTEVWVCGSPFEVNNKKNDGFLFDADNGYQTMGWYPGSNRKYVWLMTALSATDQLRQRVAWAIAQIIVVVKDAIGSEYGKSEWFLAYYDIFVRNAFGNYRDILREISYNPLMAENLSFLASKSTGYMWDRYRIKASADENFAREIMQLFTMGIIQLNMDGSAKLDSNGNKILAYTNDDIMSFSRAWTGFDLQLPRGNIEGYDNRIDPMRLIPDWRDRFPKTDTSGGYIGDAYPLCSDFPTRSFLMKGAQFRFLGSSSLPELMSDPAEFLTKEATIKVILDSTSSLRNLLCNPNSGGTCIYENLVTLPINYQCTGIECEIELVRVVQVAEDAFYEFIQPPCISLSFYNNARKISPRYRWDKVMCGDPTLPIASEACCSIGNNYATRNSLYAGERLNFHAAQNRCDAVSKDLCDFYRVGGDYYLNKGYFWTSDGCKLQVKINRDGTVAIVHRPSDFEERVTWVDEENSNSFKVYWERSGDYPTVDDNCDGACYVVPSEGSCLCDTRVVDSVVFNSMPSSIHEAAAKLNIGSIGPDVFSSGSYSTINNSDTGITAYLKDNKFDVDTIFEFSDDKGRTFLMKNMHSSVYLQRKTGGLTGHSFRNAPQFMSFVPSETTIRDAQYETEATLDHYFYSDNTAPFLAVRYIQRLVTSNPSPRYIESVANAFKTGSYTTQGESFGTGIYGDLAATFAAIYLDSEARNILLDADPFTGSLREPILKVLALMRSMNFVSLSPVTRIDRMKTTTGQMPHEFGTVFSFFLSEFKPYGRVGDANLVAPEATLVDMPKIIGLLNGLTSLVKFGLSQCEGGWGPDYCREKLYTTSAFGVLGFNRTTMMEEEFAFETFEGMSLRGGLDNRWVGRDFNAHNGKATIDPQVNNNHVLYFPERSWNGDFYSPLIQNFNNQVVKFKYLSTTPSADGCIGYIDGAREYLNTQTWALCDGNIMESNGQWITCQFEVPQEVTSFRIVVTDRGDPSGNAFFDDIHFAAGTDTLCGVDSSVLNPPGVLGYSDSVIGELATLLTAGRLGSASKDIIRDAFDSAGSAEDGLRVAQQLLLTTSEFHSTNIAKATNQPRDDIVFPIPSGKPYRAIVYIMFSGGCDSFNMLTPHTCDNDLYQTYLDVRHQVALPKNLLLPISASDQVCSKFGIHPELPAIRDLYDDEDLLFFANTGVMSQPVTKDNYYTLTNTQLFAHNHMQRETKRVDPYETNSGTGILGRMSDVLSRQGRNVASFSVDRFSVALVGKPGESDAPMIVDRNGIPQVYLDETKEYIYKLHNLTENDSGVFAETWSSSLIESLGVNDLLLAELSGVTTQVDFPSTYLGDNLETVARLIATRETRGSDVDTFYVEIGGFDTHSDVEEALNGRFKEVNDGFEAFSQEMKTMNLWNNVTLIQTSDFARTLNPNGGDGTDHAWGGNYIMMGGSVKGGKILGKYPEDITDDGPLTLDRGRMIPSTPWDTVFSGIATWLGISVGAEMGQVCPNLHKFNSSYLIDPAEMFGELINVSTPSPTESATTDSPTIFPTALPTAAPSKSPTILPTDSGGPDDECEDTSGTFDVTKSDGTVLSNRNCGWVAQQGFRCDFTGAPENCPVTCDVCSVG